MAEEANSLELSKTFKDLLLKDERSKGQYTRKNFLILYDKILKALKSALLEISIEEETARRSTYFKLDKWLACTQRYQSEYERQLAPHRMQLLKEAGLSVEIYDKTFNLYQTSEEFVQAMNATFWFAQRHSLMLRKPGKISSSQYFSYIHNELKYLESSTAEIEYFIKNVPPSSLVYILGKRVEDHVWRETQLNFADRLCFELHHTEEANQPHHKEIRDEITALYDSLDSNDRKKGLLILSRLNQEARALEEDAKKGVSSEDSSLGGRRDNVSGNSTAITKCEPLTSRAKKSDDKGSPNTKDIDIATDIKLQVLSKPESSSPKKNPKGLRLNIVEVDAGKASKTPSPQRRHSKELYPIAGSTRLFELLQYGTSTEKDLYRHQLLERNMEDIAERAIAEERVSGTYSADLALEIYEYICFKAMECLNMELIKEREEKKAVFENLEKWIDLDDEYFEIRMREIKKQEDIVCNLFRLSQENYNAAIQALCESVAGMDLMHFVFWSCFFEYNEKIKIEQGKEKTKIDIPAGELVDFYVWRENGVKNKFEMKLFKKCFAKERCYHAVKERLKNLVEQHKKRPYEQYASLIWRNPSYIIKSTGSHKKRFEEEMANVFSDYQGIATVKDYKRFLAKYAKENSKGCCNIF